MGIFRQKNTLPRSEAAMLAASDLGPIHVHLDNYRLTFEDCMWTPEYDAPEVPEGAGSIEQEICKLRKEKRRMKKELERFMAQAKEMKELKERWNLLDFKYQLLLDMWTMRALDQKKEEACGGSKRRPHSTGGMSPSREGSPKRCSPKRNGRHDSPPRNRHRFCNDSPPKRRERCD
ncbi:hypothetical protein M758_9G029600 [Ceratodon purpureus]|uniref:Uncharacterized protein n=1 Tax=Ceratodon purpureus TaxID=3225 RepID=A0A8T0GRB7_CERPU|nr:hypothetical protein KC19_9G028100 [Ceratodon purpureus]KAG0605079.1 hypothetical protein M758_9G029600 [Ceratodon purpureus]